MGVGNRKSRVCRLGSCGNTQTGGGLMCEHPTMLTLRVPDELGVV